MRLRELPRVPLVGGVTPLQPLLRLSERLGGPAIWIKRDDCTALAGGGNKARKLEYLMADARQQGADVVVTFGAVQSNHARMTAAAARKCGMDPVLVLSGPEPAVPGGNLLLDRLMDARVLFIPDYREEGAVDTGTAQVLEVIGELTEQGRNVYMIPVGGSTALGDCGYVAAVDEIKAQTEREGFTPAALCVAVGSSGTYAGLKAGCLLGGWDVAVHGVAVDTRDALDRYGMPPVHQVIGDIGELIEAPIACTADDITIDYDYVGDAYGIPSEEGLAAIKLLAETEGVLLDPVYTGKAMAGLLGAIEAGRYGRGDHVVFMHTGGLPGLFPHAQAFGL